MAASQIKKGKRKQKSTKEKMRSSADVLNQPIPTNGPGSGKGSQNERTVPYDIKTEYPQKVNLYFK